MGTGPMVLTVTPNPANSRDSTRVSASTAAFDATYAASPSNRRGTATVEKFTMRPYRAFFISFAASRQKTKHPTTFVSRTLLTLDSGVSSEWFIDAMPALFSTLSSFPCRLRTCEKSAFTCASSVTSAIVWT